MRWYLSRLNGSVTKLFDVCSLDLDFKHNPFLCLLFPFFLNTKIYCLEPTWFRRSLRLFSVVSSLLWPLFILITIFKFKKYNYIYIQVFVSKFKILPILLWHDAITSVNLLNTQSISIISWTCIKFSGSSETEHCLLNSISVP